MCIHREISIARIAKIKEPHTLFVHHTEFGFAVGIVIGDKYAVAVAVTLGSLHIGGIAIVGKNHTTTVDRECAFRYTLLHINKPCS